MARFIDTGKTTKAKKRGKKADSEANEFIETGRTSLERQLMSERA